MLQCQLNYCSTIDIVSLTLFEISPKTQEERKRLFKKTLEYICDSFYFTVTVQFTKHREEKSQRVCLTYKKYLSRKMYKITRDVGSVKRN